MSRPERVKEQLDRKAAKEVLTTTPAAEVHQRATAAVARRLEAVAKPEGRKKKGLSTDDVRALVRKVREGASWPEAKATMRFLVEDQVLEGWRDEILRQAGAGPQPRKPDGPQAKG